MTTKELKIFLIYYGVLNNKGGANTHILELLRNLDKYSHVVLFTLGTSTKIDQNNIKYVPCLNMKYCTAISYESSLFFYLLYNIMKNKPDLIYLRQDFYSYFPMILCKIFNIPFVVEINGLIQDELLIDLSSKSFIYKISSYLSMTSEKRNYRYCDKIVAVTQNLKEELQKRYTLKEGKITVIINGSNTDLFKPLPKQETLSKLCLDNSKKYICFVGSLIPWQGLEYLIQAAPLILKEYANARFLIVGDGVMKNEWMKLAGDLGVLDKFIFTGSVPYEMVPIYINAADVCVAPKKQLVKSGYSPLKLYEYMACGKPIIATRTNGFEILEESNSGILINPKNSIEFANSVLMLLTNSELMNSIGENGRKYVATNHSWDSVARKVLDICNDVVENHKNQ